MKPIITGLICASLCFAGAYVIAVRKAAEAAPLYCTDWPPCCRRTKDLPTS